MREDPELRAAANVCAMAQVQADKRAGKIYDELANERPEKPDTV